MIEFTDKLKLSKISPMIGMNQHLTSKHPTRGEQAMAENVRQLPINPLPDAPDMGLREFTAMADNSPFNLIFCDKDFKIVYLNPRSIESLESIEEHLHIPVSKIKGAPIDVFHKTPPHPRELYEEGFYLPRSIQIKIGPEDLELILTPVYDRAKEHVGTMVTWNIVTQRLRVGRTLERYQLIVENMATNVLLCDRDYIIRAANESALKIMRSLEKYLPISVDQIVGSSMDIFHKNPAHQRKLLANDQNLPYKIKISIGPEKVEMHISAVYDGIKHYVGTLVTFEVVTTKMVRERHMARLQSMMRRIPINVLMVDRHLNIVYMNAKSLETLKRIERFLPMPIEKMLGQPIGVFCKISAEHQTMLKSGHHPPQTLQVKVGPTSITLEISALFYQAKIHLGSLLIWDIQST
jgi:methyl-accepting chemotaxis protein